MDITKTRAARIAFSAVTLVVALGLVPMALAAKGGKNGPNSESGYTGTFNGPPVMAVDQNSDGHPNAGDSVTFNVSSSAPYPFVQLSCSQNGSQVVQETLGFFGSWSRTFYLGGMVWTSGAADCTATLYSVSFSGATEPTEATLNFHVDG